MTQCTMDLSPKADKVANIVKIIFGFKDKREAINKIVEDYEDNLEFPIRAEYVERIKKIEKGKFHSFDTMDDLQKLVESKG